MNRNRNSRGFTLIEILIALAMMATIMSMVYGSYAATTQSVETYSSRLDCSERASLILRLMARQIRCVYIPPTDPNTTGSSGNIDRTQTRARSIARHGTEIDRSSPSFCGNAQGRRGEVLDFVTTIGLGAGLKGPRGLSRIRYRHDPLTDTLWIDRRPYMDRLRKADSTQTGQPILDHVTTLDVEFCDGQQWLKKWNGVRNREVPQAVRISLSLVDEEGRSYRFGTTVRIQSQTAVAPTTSKQSIRGRRL